MTFTSMTRVKARRAKRLARLIITISRLYTAADLESALAYGRDKILLALYFDATMRVGIFPSMRWRPLRQYL